MSSKHAFCSVKLVGESGWSKAELLSRNGYACVIVVSKSFTGKITRITYDSSEVDTIRVTNDFPIELFDVAIESGFYIIGMPSSKRK